MSSAGWKPGDWVIYRKQKRSASPGPRAKEVFPAGAGETYAYLVDKYWIVDAILDDGRLRLRTRRGKQHVISPEDPRLRHLKWWERLLLGSRFRSFEDTQPDSG